MTELSITYTETETKGSYAAKHKGIEDEAELITSKVSPTLIIADHTGVPDSMRGLSVGRALVEHLIADARTKGQRIIPLCPFVRAHSQKNRGDLADVIHGRSSQDGASQAAQKGDTIRS
jgi:predicted GNAT family acetyltransferase